MELSATDAADQLGLAGLVRLPYGRMVLLWNECMRYPYPHPAVLADGTVLATTGQGAGRVNIVRIDPEWLCEYPCHGHAVTTGSWWTASR